MCFLMCLSTLCWHQLGRVLFFVGYFEGVVKIERLKSHNELSPKRITPPNEQEQKLLVILRQLDYGEVRIIVKNGVPVHVEEIKKSIKL